MNRGGIYLLLAFPGLIFLAAPALFNTLGSKPWKKLLIHSGYCAVGLLALTLILAPLTKHFPLLQFFKKIRRYRKEAGNALFVYATLHFLFYIIDSFIRKGGLPLTKFLKPVVYTGFFSFLILLPLAITSNHYSMKRLGYATWKNLHRTIYLAELFIFIHLFLQDKLYALLIFIPLAFIQLFRRKKN